MKIPEFIAAVKASSPKAFAKLNDAQVRQVTSAVIQELGKAIDQAGEESVVAIPTLGRFKVRMVPSKDDPSTKVRRVTFVRAKAGAAKPSKAK